MAITKLITVSSGSPTPVTVQTWTDRVTVGEDASVVGYPTTDFKVMKPASTNDAERVQAGGRYTFTKPSAFPAAYFGPNEVAGYIQTITGSTTFIQDES